ncbi:MAG TPA: hypothetical protein VD948_06865 [Rhodothermales bacterium]|nr:hypothetical protein [Rhodothermales bacterium]
MDVSTARSRHLSARRLVLYGAALVVLFLVMRRVLDPFGTEEYLEVSHGNHAHFVPRDRNPEASISNFPTTRPAPGQCITPDGPIGVRQGSGCVAQR